MVLTLSKVKLVISIVAPVKDNVFPDISRQVRQEVFPTLDLLRAGMRFVCM